jgi:hypothetical protein
LYPPYQWTAEVRSRKADRIRKLAQRLVGNSAQRTQYLVLERHPCHVDWRRSYPEQMNAR